MHEFRVDPKPREINQRDVRSTLYSRAQQGNRPRPHMVLVAAVATIAVVVVIVGVQTVRVLKDLQQIEDGTHQS